MARVGCSKGKCGGVGVKYGANTYKPFPRLLYLFHVHTIKKTHGYDNVNFPLCHRATSVLPKSPPWCVRSCRSRKASRDGHALRGSSGSTQSST